MFLVQFEALFSIWHFTVGTLELRFKNWHLLLYLSSSCIALQVLLVDTVF